MMKSRDPNKEKKIGASLGNKDIIPTDYFTEDDSLEDDIAETPENRQMTEIQHKKIKKKPIENFDKDSGKK